MYSINFIQQRLGKVFVFKQLFLLCLLCFSSFLRAEAALTASSTTSTDGVVVLSWQNKGASVFVQQAVHSPDSFSTIYHGKDQSTVLSGLSNADYFFRLGIAQQNAEINYSEPVKVSVEHHSLSKAWFFFTLGAVVFIATIGLIVSGSRK